MARKFDTITEPVTGQKIVLKVGNREEGYIFEAVTDQGVVATGESGVVVLNEAMNRVRNEREASFLPIIEVRLAFDDVPKPTPTPLRVSAEAILHFVCFEPLLLDPLSGSRGLSRIYFLYIGPESLP